MQSAERYPYSFKLALQQDHFENIFDSNMFSAYIPRELPVPRINDPRKTQRCPLGIERHPSYVNSAQINQIFSYIGFLKRKENKEYLQYLPLLYKELNLFLRILEDIIYNLNIAIPVEIYQEQKRGLEYFFVTYRDNSGHKIDWISRILKHQKSYLEHLDMLIETLKARGKVFDFSNDPLYETIVEACQTSVDTGELESPNEIDFRYVANCCVKAARDRETKNLWSGDRHILNILKALYTKSDIYTKFPQSYLYSSYDPGNHTRRFPMG